MPRSLHEIIQDALARPLPRLPLSLHARQLCGICKELAFGTRGRRFFIATRSPARALGITPYAVHELLKELTTLGIIRVAQRGDPVKGGMASEFEWCGLPRHEPADDSEAIGPSAPRGPGLGLFRRQDRPHARPARAHSFDRAPTARRK